MTRSAHLLRLGLAAVLALGGSGIGRAAHAGEPLADLPMTFHHGLPMIEGSLRRGSTSCLVVDTGAQIVLVGTAESRRLRLRSSPTRFAAVSSSSSYRTAIAGIGVPGLLVGRAWVPFPQAAAAPILVDVDGTPYCDAVLGLDLFRSFVVEVDYPAKRLRVHDARDWSVPNDAIALDADWLPMGVRVPITLDLPDGRRIDGRFLVDTGADDHAAIYPTTRFARRMGLADSTAGARQHSRGGDPRGAEVRLDDVAAEFAGLRLPHLALSFDEHGHGALGDAETRIDGVVGYGVLRHFNVVFDPRGRRLLLVTPFARTLRTPAVNGVFVASVVPATPP